MKIHNVAEILAMGGIDKYGKKKRIKQDLSKVVGTIKLTPKQDKDLDALMYGQSNK